MRFLSFQNTPNPEPGEIKSAQVTYQNLETGKSQVVGEGVLCDVDVFLAAKRSLTGREKVRITVFFGPTEVHTFEAGQEV